MRVHKTCHFNREYGSRKRKCLTTAGVHRLIKDSTFSLWPWLGNNAYDSTKVGVATVFWQHVPVHANGARPSTAPQCGNRGKQACSSSQRAPVRADVFRSRSKTGVLLAKGKRNLPSNLPWKHNRVPEDPHRDFPLKPSIQASRGFKDLVMPLAPGRWNSLW